MKCFVLKSGEIIPANKVDEFRETNGKTVVKYTKYVTLAGVKRKMICYDEAIKFRKMTQKEEEKLL